MRSVDRRVGYVWKLRHRHGSEAGKQGEDDSKGRLLWEERVAVGQGERQTERGELGREGYGSGW